jgi:putative FmdB family regulatory protein
MPIYEYECPDCNRRVESYTSLSESDEPVHCKVCFTDRNKKVLLKRLISLTAPPQFGPGQPGTSSQAEWAARQKSMLEKRSAEYDKSPAGQDEIHKSLVRARKNNLL